MTSKLDKAKKALEVANELGLWDKIVRVAESYLGSKEVGNNGGK